ncbi:hypothetical protein ACVIGB_000875 [Bradyrhizobium sp. USDA 4341]
MVPSIDIQDPEFLAWFGNSGVVDSSGAPLLVFRGEHGRREGNAFQSRLGSISFADLDSAAIYARQPNDRTEIARDPRVMPAYLRIERPFMLEPDDPYLELSTIIDALGRAEAIRVAVKFEAWIRRTDNWDHIQDGVGRDISVADFIDRYPRRLTKIYFMAYPFLDDPVETAKLRAAGFDGAVHAGSAVTAGRPEYKIFAPESIMPAAPCWLTPEEAEGFGTANQAVRPRATPASP